jgi:hypothetical protein
MNIGEKAKSIIAAVAPTIGLAFGGPFGAMAGKILGGVLGGDEKAVESAILSGDPDTMAKVRIAEIEFQKRIEELGLERDKLAYADTSDARAREIAVRDTTPAILAYAITVGFFGTLLFMLLNGKPTVGGDALLVMLGSLGTAWAGIVAYYFGSSSGSARKDATISAIAKS